MATSSESGTSAEWTSMRCWGSVQARPPASTLRTPGPPLRDNAAIFREKSVVIGSYVVLAALFWLLLSKTVFGRHVRAIGDNPTAALYAGLPILRTQLWVYTLAGLLAGIAGVLYAAENNQGNPNAGVAYELDAIAAVVIGGTRLSGGQGTIAGTIIGTLIMGVLTNMLRLNNIDSNVEMMIKAVIIVLAVAVQRSRKS